MRFRVNNFRLGGPGQRQDTDSGCACHQRICIKLPLKGIGDFECLTGLGSAGHESSSEGVSLSVARVTTREKKVPINGKFTGSSQSRRRSSVKLALAN